jgi:hypothetical protein
MTDMVPLPPVDGSVPVEAADAVLVARSAAAGDYIAGLILAAQLDTVGTPRKLPMDVWPQADPAVPAVGAGGF